MRDGRLAETMPARGPDRGGAARPLLPRSGRAGRLMRAPAAVWRASRHGRRSSLFFAVLLPETFLTARNWLNISQQVSMLAVVAAAMTVVMAMGDFDLSVGAMASLAGVVAATAFVAGWPVWAGVLAALGGRARRRAVQRRPGQPRRHPALRRDAGDADDLFAARPSSSATGARSSAATSREAFGAFARGGIGDRRARRPAAGAAEPDAGRGGCGRR